MIICPKCGQENPDNVRNCSNCKVNLQFALENAEKMKAQWEQEKLTPEEYRQKIEDTRRRDEEIRRRDEEIRRRDEEKQRIMLQELFLATTPVIQGKTISEYLGIASSAFVLGTGIFSEINASIADFFGTESGVFQRKLVEARELVIINMKKQAHESGGNGIIGIEFDYMTIGNNMIMVSASGTIVKFDS